MATDHLGLLSLPQLQNQPTINPSSATGSWMWNPKLQTTQAQARVQDDNDSWEERAFEEDTNHAMGTTWPPRSYTCTFCMREFKSAQALGGHMNVHRRDRARLHHQVQPDTNTSPVLEGANFSTNIFTTQDVMENRGVRLLYMLPNPNPGGINGDTNSHSSRLSMPQFQTNNLMSYFPTSSEFPVISRSVDFSKSHCSNIEPSALISHTKHQINNRSDTVEELDLELRLGRNSSLS